MPFPSLARCWPRPSGLLNAHDRSSEAGFSSSSSQLAIKIRPCLRCGVCQRGSSNSSRCCWGRDGVRLGRYQHLSSGRSAVGTASLSQPHSGASSSPAQPCPLHACLLRYGITDPTAFSAPKHLALSQEEVSSNVKPELAALAAEGLSPKQVAGLMGHKTHPLLSCSYKNTFLPNLQLLRKIGAYTKHKPYPRTAHLSAAGKVLVKSPGAAARYLSRDPGKVQQLLQWLEGSLGLGLERRRLAACRDLCMALSLSAATANALCLSLQEQQVPAMQVAHMLVEQPTIFGIKPGVLSARLGALQQHLGLDAAAALHVAIAYPRLLTNNLVSTLPLLLRFLDGYMGERGRGAGWCGHSPQLVHSLPHQQSAASRAWQPGGTARSGSGE